MNPDHWICIRSHIQNSLKQLRETKIHGCHFITDTVFFILVFSCIGFCFCCRGSDMNPDPGNLHPDPKLYNWLIDCCRAAWSWPPRLTCWPRCARPSGQLRLSSEAVTWTPWASCPGTIRTTLSCSSEDRPIAYLQAYLSLQGHGRLGTSSQTI